jgi:membrane-bound ClpP family serine protease
MEERKRSHLFDLKLPLGGLLGFYGLILFVYGLLTKPESYHKSFGLNVNLYWGGLLLLIGALMLLFSFKKKKAKAAI